MKYFIGIIMVFVMMAFTTSERELELKLVSYSPAYYGAMYEYKLQKPSAGRIDRILVFTQNGYLNGKDLTLIIE